ncbi:YbgC/FadM family acyl-CoA thioesterase [Sphingomonas mesophila]|uniref:YbgC/FadM family acyl-CoA thioesterase n=1 Tax=Sphingomonas mesophila TaxID=2303576 RepID=UPI000E57C116|nr:YbgC/FadM family acyl-CoA thioesterase [Sphingomonas mesophila]
MTASPFDTPYRGGFVGAHHHFALTVYFEDTDTAGIVYYANYLKFMERARSDMLRSVGIDQRAAKEDGIGVYAVAEAHVRYLRPARLGDDLVIVSSVEQVRAASVHIHQRVMRGAEHLADGRITAAFLGPDDRPRRQPREWVDRFHRLSED